MKKEKLFNEANLYNLFNILNTLIFNDSIKSRPIFQALPNRRALLAVNLQDSNKILFGICFAEKPVRIVFNTKVITTHRLLVITLVHEMIHMLQFETGCKESHHGPMFQNWRRKIKRRHHIDI